ncbi:MAG: threonine aldolase family protein [Phocaeicola sp.]|uniref:threonine aldolase family protein n=1 Tax=Phocaeicola sp. TaxID=2773926 RepID=UPI003FA0BDB4
MISFECDYNNGAHPLILKSLMETNNTRTSGYGFDPFTESAKEKIKKAIGIPEADIYFLIGGTQTNATVIDSLLRNYEGVISVDSGHITIHESGAIEASGHKVLPLKGKEGKLDAASIDAYMKRFFADETNPHCVQPGMVYITFPTELGTLYTKQELDKIYQVCMKYELPLFVDGARLGYGLMSDSNDVSIHYLATHCDVFYIGGTKVGAFCGEAVVFTNMCAPKHFFTTVKQHGALMAKGRLLGIQFDTLFTDNLYFNISRHAIEMANQLKKLFIKRGYKMAVDSPTNQQFILLNQTQYDKLRQNVAFEIWERINAEQLVCRFVTSWATTEEDINQLEQLL